MDVFGLQHAAYIGFVGLPRTQAFDGGGFVAEGFEKGIGKFCVVERLGKKLGDGGFDFDGVHGRECWFYFKGVGLCGGVKGCYRAV
nr:hypothetical protein [Neisseria chenwenguii]